MASTFESRTITVRVARPRPDVSDLDHHVAARPGVEIYTAVALRADLTDDSPHHPCGCV